MKPAWDAVVVGSGPNGLAAAIALAEAGHSVCVREATLRIGGGMHSSELTLPGFLHDECSAIHPMGVLSPYLRTLPLAEHGLEWLPFPASVAHPLDHGPAAMLYQSLGATAERLGVDGPKWRRLVAPFLDHADDLLADLMGPFGFAKRRPLQMARFGRHALFSAAHVARAQFRDEPARALFAGCAAHSILPLDMATTAALGLLFAVTGHVQSWPCVRGGSAQLAQAMGALLTSLGGVIETDRRVTSLADVDDARVVLFDLTPRPFLAIAGEALPPRYVRSLENYRYGPGTFKVDYALDGPIPWRDPAVGEASTVHVGGTLDELMASERAAWEGHAHERPFVMVCQQSHVDASRAPIGKHTGYAYCHVPHGYAGDATPAIERQIERFAPGFGDLVLARHVTTPAQFEHANPNYVGGTVTGGAAHLPQLFTRPTVRLDPYSTPNERLFICSASTPPGGGVHGMCGFHAAQSALKRLARA